MRRAPNRVEPFERAGDERCWIFKDFARTRDAIAQSGQRQAASITSQNHAANAIYQPWIAALTALMGLSSLMVGGATKRMSGV